MKLDVTHVLLIIAIVLSASAGALQSGFTPGSTGALVLGVLSAVGLALKASVLPSVSIDAAIESVAKK